jgi:hypothetical protein
MTLLRDVVPAEDTVPAGPRAPRLPRFLLVGATCGVAWAAALRGWMIQPPAPTRPSTWLGTFGLLLPPGLLVGALLG